MGVIEEAISCGRQMPVMNLHINGKLSSRAVFKPMNSNFPYPLMIEQSETERILENHLLNYGIDVERKANLTDLEIDNDIVNATLEHSDGSLEKIQVKWLIGCDGAHSIVRHKINIPFEGAPYGHDFIQTDIKVDWPQNYNEGHGFISDKGILVCIPMRGEQRYRLITLREKENPNEPTLQEFQSIIKKLGPKGMEISEPTWLIRFKLHHRMAAAMKKGPVFIAGDASHIHSPVGGQGMNTGIQDAYNLAWKLAKVIKEESLPVLLDSYNEERHPVGKKIIMFTDVIFKSILSRNPFILKARAFVAPMVLKQKWISDKVMKTASQLNINYRHSPFVEQHWHGVGPAAGDRAPDALLYLTSEELRKIRLFEIIKGTKFHFLLFAGINSKENEYIELEKTGMEISHNFKNDIETFMIAAETPPVLPAWQGKVFVDASQYVHKLYGVSSPAIYLIRPDGYIGFKSKSVKLEVLQTFLKRIIKA